MYSYVIIASTGQGKSTFVRKLCGNAPMFVFDVNDEYNELSLDANKSSSRYLGGDVQEFTDMCRNKHNGTFCVFEEATGFFSGKMEKDMRSLVIGKRHPVEYGGRNLVFLFHSINSVPPFLFELANYIVLFKTGDNELTVKKKNPKLLQAYYSLRNAPKYKPVIIKNV